ncbi:hypothetical protein Nepgr_033349 [Nepenthes gracilis]|uniref:WRKY domain-containing protein n=1 Tax=Nepenthes gracilis TaxID=150966 RepID=A0AAD3TLW7_NEPGR|nr:hypothetical protein Nepgr_033349 [Nepenthes gracilis]
MEAAVDIADGGYAVKGDQRGDRSDGDDEARKEEISLKAPSGSMPERPSNGRRSESLAASKKNEKTKVDELKSTKAEMGEVMEENQRLKLCLDQIKKEYQALQMKFLEITCQETPKNRANSNTNDSHSSARDLEEEVNLVSLSLGRSSSIDSRSKINVNTSGGKGKEGAMDDEGKGRGLLTLGLDNTLDISDKTMTVEEEAPNSSPEDSLEELRDEAAAESSQLSGKMLKNMRRGEDEVAAQAPVKRARVSVRVRCDTPTVQRCADDMSILITTYEGTHNHPLPFSATAMASTTSAAAYMLTSSSSNSTLGSNLSTITATSAAATTMLSDLQQIKFNLSDISRSKPFFLPPSSLISSSPSHSTITLDLTSSTSSSSTTQFNTATSSTFAPRYSSTTLTFNSSEFSNSIPMTWPKGLLNYTTQSYSSNNQAVGPSMSTGRRHEDSFYQGLLYMSSGTTSTNSQLSLQDSVAAAAKALTSDPGFQSVLTATLSSFISGGSNGGTGGSNGGGAINVGNFITEGDGSSLTQKLKWGDQATAAAASSLSEGNGCASSFLIAPTKNSQSAGSLGLLSSPLPFSISNSSSTSPSDGRDLNS